MGGIAIWSMHFIGNRAIVLENGEPELQIVYNPGVTAASFFLPILALIVPLCAAGISENVSRISIVISGTLTGFAICGMHYLAQAGIANYTGVYHPAYIVGSAIVACIASIAALGIFFVLRAAWTNSWWKRLLCALLLSAGISGMHWLGTAGTDYRTKDLDTAYEDNMSRGGPVVVVLVLSISTCILLLTIAMIAHSQVLRNANKAKQIVLASATFDHNGNLMVKPEGSLPSRTITKSYIEGSLEDVFNVSHEAFQWIFRATHNWAAVVDLIPGMRNHMRAISTPENSYLETTSTDAGNMEINGNFSRVFKELFCVAAQDLAEQIHEPLEEMGILYDGIMNTGTTQFKRAGRLSSLSSGGKTSPDIEHGRIPISFGRGQLLFVVRLANKVEAGRLQASGFRFADVQSIADSLARNMQVTREELLRYIEGMQQYSKQNRVLEPGVHTACFAIRPSVLRSFDIVVRKDTTNLLPSIPMQLDDLESSHIDLLRHMADWTVAACLTWLRDQRGVTSGDEEIFVRKFYESLAALAAYIDHPSFLEARLVGHPITVQSPSSETRNGPGTTKILAFHRLVDIHTRRPISRVKFSPYNFFKCQQNVCNNPAEQVDFASEVRREFGPLLDDKSSPCNPAARFSAPSSSNLARDVMNRSSFYRGIHRSWRLPGRGASLKYFRAQNTSQKNLVKTPTTETYGGITVTRDIQVETTGIDSASEQTVELEDFSNRRGPVTTVTASESFLDELFAITIKSHQKSAV